MVGLGGIGVRQGEEEKESGYRGGRTRVNECKMLQLLSPF